MESAVSLFHRVLLAEALLARDWLLGLAIVAATLMALGRKQRVEGKGSWRAFLGVVLTLSLIATLPLAMYALAAIGTEGSDALATAAAMTFMSTLICAQMVMPIRLIGIRKELPALDNAEILSQIAALSRSMGLQPPAVRIVKLSSGQFSLFAGVAGLQAPSIVIFQGIVDRLEADERGAILAHELAHLANRSFWYFVIPFPVAGVLTLGLQSWLPGLPGIPFGLCLGFGLHYIVHRWFELDCDRRGARATSFRAMQSALAMLHADHGRGSQSLLTSLAYATVTHPHRDVRLAELYHCAPDEQKEDLRPPAPEVTRHRRLSRIALAVWVFILSYAIAAAARPDRFPEISGALLLATTFAPSFLLIFGHRRHSKWERQRAGRTLLEWRRIAWFTVWLVGLIFILPLIVVLLVEAGLDEQATPTVLTVMASSLLTIVMLRRRRRKLEAEMTACLVAHQFEELLALADLHAHKVAKQPELRHWAALARVATGDRERAAEELSELIRDKPRFPPARLTLGAILLDQGQFEAAIKQATQVARLLPHDPWPWVKISHIQRRCRRWNDAEQAARRALELDPTSGLAEAVLAAIALDQGNLQRATELIERANEHAPGMCLVRVVAAEIACATRSADAERLVQAALRSIESEPFAFMETEKQWLQSVLSEPKDERQPLVRGD